MRRPQIGANGMVYVKCNDDGTFKSSVDKFFTQEDLAEWAKAANAQPGDLILVILTMFVLNSKKLIEFDKIMNKGKSSTNHRKSGATQPPARASK